MKRIILITGGQRSGKSRQAEEMALSLSPHPVYMATAHVWDEEFRRRVAVHQARRGSEWTNIEEEKFLSRHDVAGRVVLIDCCTLWVVTNEIGMGGTSVNALQRRFTDLMGWFNQYVARQANEVYLMVAGLKVKVK